MTMSLHRHVLQIIVICSAIIISGCISQNGGDFVPTETPIELKASVLVGTDEFLYAMYAQVTCLDWEGNTIWESPFLGGNGLIYLGDSFFVETFDKSEKVSGVALLNLKGEILWQKEIGRVSSRGIGASHNLLVVGSSRTGALSAFSRTGDVLWTYDHSSGIDQITVSSDGSHVVFTDYDNAVNCVCDGELIWSQDVGHVETGWSTRNLAIAPDSTYCIYGSEKGGAHIVASTLEGDILWSHPVREYLLSVAISDDSSYIVAGAFDNVYKFSRDGTKLWSAGVGGNNDYIALTPAADFIVIGSNGLPADCVVLDGDGKVLWKARSFDTIFSVGISPDGRYVAFSNRLHQLFILPNPPESSNSH